MSEPACSAICNASVPGMGAEKNDATENQLAAGGLGVVLAAGDGGRPLFISAYYRFGVGKQSKVSDFSHG